MCQRTAEHNEPSRVIKDFLLHQQKRRNIGQQDLSDLTATPLCEYLDEVFKTLNEGQRNNLERISKWGCDTAQTSFNAHLCCYG